MIFVHADKYINKPVLIETVGGRVEDVVLQTAKSGTLIKFKTLGWLKFTECELMAVLSE